MVLLLTKMIGTLEVFKYIFRGRYFFTLFQLTNHPNIEHTDSVCEYDEFSIIKFRVLTKQMKVRFSNGISNPPWILIYREFARTSMDQHYYHNSSFMELLS